MYAHSLMLSASLAAVASAHLPAVVKRDFVQPRQTDGLDDKCQNALKELMPVYNALPTPPPVLLSATLPADPCVTPSFKGETAKAWNSYTSEAFGWFSSHSSEIVAALSDCPELLSVAQTLPVCTTTTSSTSKKATPTPKPTAQPETKTPATSATSAAPKTTAEETPASSAAPTTSAIPATSAKEETPATTAAVSTDIEVANATPKENDAPATTSDAEAAAPSEALAAREKGMMGAVLVAAGLVGAVAIL